MEGEKGRRETGESSFRIFFLGVIERERGREVDKEALMGAVSLIGNGGIALKSFDAATFPNGH
jgi:hypothetical protein